MYRILQSRGHQYYVVITKWPYTKSDRQTCAAMFTPVKNLVHHMHHHSAASASTMSVLEAFLYNSAHSLDEKSRRSIRSVGPSVRDLSDNLQQSMVTSTKHPIDLNHHRYTNLRELTVGKTNNMDFLDMIYLPKLTTLTMCNNCTIEDISALAACTNLEHMNLSGTGVIDISVLAACTHLEHLDLRNTFVIDISALAECTNLKHLNLSGTDVIDISALAECTNLEHLDLYITAIVDISALAACTHLDHLDLYDTDVDDISDLNASSLLHLNLSKTKVSDLDPLSLCTALRELDLSETEVSDLTPLALCTDLRDLDLYRTNVSDLTPLIGCKQMESIDLAVTDASEEDVCDLLDNTDSTSLTVYMNVEQTSDDGPLQEYIDNGTVYLVT